MIKNMFGKKSIDEIFIEVCRKGFLSYAMFLLKENKINIHAYSEDAFVWSCVNGHMEIAHW